MKEKIRTIENEFNNYVDIQNPEDVRLLIDFAEKWAKVVEIYQDPLKSCDDVLDFINKSV